MNIFHKIMPCSFFPFSPFTLIFVFMIRSELLTLITRIENIADFFVQYSRDYLIKTKHRKKDGNQDLINVFTNGIEEPKPAEKKYCDLHLYFCGIQIKP